MPKLIDLDFNAFIRKARHDLFFLSCTAFHTSTYLFLFSTGRKIILSLFPSCEKVFYNEKSNESHQWSEPKLLKVGAAWKAKSKSLACGSGYLHYIQFPVLWRDSLRRCIIPSGQFLPCSISILSLFFLTCLWAMFGRRLWTPADVLLHNWAHISAECLVDLLPLLSAQDTKWSIDGLAACKVPH